MANDRNRARPVLVCLVVICIVILLLLAATIVYLTFRQQSQTQEAAAATSEQTVPETTTLATEETTLATVETTEATTAQTTEATTAETTEETTEETTVPETTQETVVQQPALLSAYLLQRGITYQELQQRGCTQLITVEATGNRAQIRYFFCEDGLWQELPALTCNGFVGRSGVYERKQEGDGSTPAGLYSIGSGFYIQQPPETGLDLFQITKDTYWVDDPDSKFYNQRIEGTENKDWDSAEHMIDYSVYRYGFVVDYNVTAEYNAGSAIFFHITAKSTAGCIGTEESLVLEYLEQLNKSHKPHILILNQIPEAETVDTTENDV